MRIKTTIAAALVAFAALCATARAASGPHVHLTWTEPTTTIPVGFNIYRAVQVSGACPTFGASGWSKIIGGIPASAPVWDDYTIASNTTYCFAATAYDTTNGASESGPSNIITVVVPVITPNTPSPNGLSGSYSAQ